MELECDLYKQIEGMVSDSLLPQKYKMEYIWILRNSESTLHS